MFLASSVFLIVAATAQGGGASAPQGQIGVQQTQAPARDAMLPEKKGTGIIKGPVVTADGGRPLRRVQVTVASPELSEARNVSTSARDVFEVKDLPPGRHGVWDDPEFLKGLQERATKVTVSEVGGASVNLTLRTR